MAAIERLDPEQWERLREIRLRALADAPDAFGSTLDREQRHDEAAWRRLSSIGPWWLAVDDGDDVGLVSAAHREGDPVARVYSMWVDPGVRGTGVADALLDAVVRHATDAGASTLSLDVTDRVARAQRFYERAGFVPTGVVVPLDRDASICLIELELALPQAAATTA